MKLNKTIIAGLIFAFALGLVIADGRRLTRIEEEQTRALRLLPFAAEDINRISITRRGEPLELRREGETWRILRPVVANAEARAIGDLLYYLENEQRTPDRDLPDERRAAYGLAVPPLIVSIQAEGTDDAFGFAIGGDTAAHGRVYARFNDTAAASETGSRVGEFFTVSDDLRDQLMASAYDYRDKALFAFDATEAESVSLTFEGRSTQIDRGEAGWSIERPAAMRADETEMTRMLSEFQATRAVDFVNTDTLTLSNYGLDAPAMIATIERPGESEPERSTLLVGHRRVDSESPSYYAMRLGRDSVFSVPQPIVRSLRASIDELRARNLFTLRADEATSLTLEFGPKSVQLGLDSGGAWALGEPAPAELDQNFTNALMNKIIGLRAVGFAKTQPSESDAGLDDPRLRIIVGDAGGARREGFETGKLTRVGGREFVYARRLGETDILLLDSGEPGAFFLHRDDFLDKTIFHFDRKLVARIEIADNSAAINFERREQMWIGKNDKGDEYQLSANAIEALLLRLLALKWKRILNPELERDATLLKTQRVEEPKITYRFIDSGGEELAVLGQGENNDSSVFLGADRERYYEVSKDEFVEFFNSVRGLISSR